MASKRIAKSVVDWAAFAERVPANQKDAFRALKAKSDAFISRIHRHPENMAPIDFAYYQSRIAAPGMVDKFQKAFQGLNIPYPTDKEGIKAKVDVQEKDAAMKTAGETAKAREMIDDAKALLTKIDSLPPLDEMTMEMYGTYFPEMARDPVNNPTFWPHTKSMQPKNDPNNIP